MIVIVNKFPPRLTFASPWAKLNSAIDQELLQCFTPQKYTCIQSKILLRIRINWSDFRTYPYYLQPWGFLAFTWVLSNWKTEWSSQALCFKFFISPLFWSFYKFSNKTQRFHCMTLSSLSIYVVFVDPHQGIKMILCLFSSYY